MLIKSPGTVFLSMFPHNLVDSMQWEYNLYSQQKEISLGVDKMEALTLLGIMLLSGYSRLSYRFIGQNELIFTILWSVILWGRTGSMLS